LGGLHVAYNCSVCFCSCSSSAFIWLYWSISYSYLGRVIPSVSARLSPRSRQTMIEQTQMRKWHSIVAIRQAYGERVEWSTGTHWLVVSRPGQDYCRPVDTSSGPVSRQAIGVNSLTVIRLSGNANSRPVSICSVGCSSSCG